MHGKLRILGVVVLLAMGAGLAAVASRPYLERRVGERLARVATRLGATSSLGSLRLGLWPPLKLNEVSLVKAGQWTLAVESVALTPRLSLRGYGIALGRVQLLHASGLELELAPSRWNVWSGEASGEAEMAAPARGLRAEWSDGPGRQMAVQTADFAASGVLALRREGRALLDPGTLDGSLKAMLAADGEATLVLDLRASGFRLGSLSEVSVLDSLEPTFGEPSDGALRLDGRFSPVEGRLEVPSFQAAAGGADVSGQLTLDELPKDPRIDLTLAVGKVDFARLFGASGLEPPPGLVLAQGPADAGSLGAASLHVRVRGRLREARSFAVNQRLDFSPPARPIPALERLRGDFEHVVTSAAGGRRTLFVGASSPDFVALTDVPPLFVSTLLLGEDSAFFGHRGIDLSEIPGALVTNWQRGGAARGASTITQQLAKNLFLARDKRLARKLHELSLALLLESTLSKERLLEIYLNVIEWGPDLYGLRPAARRYFDKEPKDLAPAEMAFLVALIPGPVKYQRSFASGSLSPGFRPLVDDLLAKVHSTGALTSDDYEKARQEPLSVRTAEPGP